MTPTGRRPLQCSKHHGAGNDFVVIVSSDEALCLSAQEARAICDRHRGVGADGVIVIGPPRHGCELSMVLRNADGGEAEMSGNGMRCLAQAAVGAGLVSPPRFTVDTAAGPKVVDFVPGDDGHDWASVDMGPVTLGDDQPQEFTDRRARLVDVGNPHLVLFGPDPADVEVAVLGPRLETLHPGGVNVEFISLGAVPDELVLRVWERGVGETLACGTGSCAAAAAARSWGLVGDQVRVHNPGGPLDVTLGAGAGDAVTLAGPVRKVADLAIDLSSLTDIS